MGGDVTGGVASTVTSLIPWRLLRQNGPGTGRLHQAPAEALTARETAALQKQIENSNFNFHSNVKSSNLVTA